MNSSSITTACIREKYCRLWTVPNKLTIVEALRLIVSLTSASGNKETCRLWNVATKGTTHLIVRRGFDILSQRNKGNNFFFWSDYRISRHPLPPRRNSLKNEENNHGFYYDDINVRGFYNLALFSNVLSFDPVRWNQNNTKRHHNRRASDILYEVDYTKKTTPYF